MKRGKRKNPNLDSSKYVFDELKEFKELLEECDDNPKDIIPGIRRRFNFFWQDIKIKREMSKDELEKIIDTFMTNYDKLKEYEGINEILQIVLSDYNELPIDEKSKNEYIFDKDVQILGNPGAKISVNSETEPNRFTSDYIERIIKSKIANNLDVGINAEDIINILQQESNNMYFDLEGYQNLINSSVISAINGDTEIINPKILKVVSDLATSYKIQHEYLQALDVYDKGLNISGLYNTDEYKELKKDRDLLMELVKNFDVKRFDNFEAFLKSVELGNFNKEIFDKTPTGKKRSRKAPKDLTEKKETYKMPKEEKLKALGILIDNLKKENPNIDIKKIFIGKDKFKSYILCPIENSNVTIMENFKSDINEALYIVPNEHIEEIVEMKKMEASKVDNVKTVRHTENFDNYVERLTDRVRESMNLEKSKTVVKKNKVRTKEIDKGEKDYFDNFETAEKIDYETEHELVNGIDEQADELIVEENTQSIDSEQEIEDESIQEVEDTTIEKNEEKDDISAEEQVEEIESEKNVETKPTFEQVMNQINVLKAKREELSRQIEEKKQEIASSSFEDIETKKEELKSLIDQEKFNEISVVLERIKAIENERLRSDNLNHELQELEEKLIENGIEIESLKNDLKNRIDEM